MPDTPPFPPEIEQIIRKQLSSGRYHNENEVFSAALHLLDEQSSLPVASLESVFGMWKGRDEDGLILERRIRNEWSV